MKIVLGIDESPCSRTALEFMKRMPWARDADWRLVSVVRDPMTVYVMSVMAAEAVEAMQVQRDAQTSWLKGIDDELREAGVSCRATVDVSDARTSLVQAAHDEHADLLVVGAHGRTGLPRWMLGSVAAHVVVHAPCSVLVVKRAFEPRDTRPMTILLGVDGSPCSEEAVSLVRRLSWPRDTRLHLLSAIAPPRHPFVEAGPISIHAAREEARIQQEIVSRYERLARDAGWTTESSVPDGDPRTELVSTATRLDADLIAVGSHGRTGLSRLVLGSVASHLVSHAPCSVLVVKRGARREPD
jgi:nucleotide-binding universal stress UspA family protein